MQIRLFSVPIFGGEEEIEELNKFLRGNKVVDIFRSSAFDIRKPKDTKK